MSKKIVPTLLPLSAMMLAGFSFTAQAAEATTTKEQVLPTVTVKADAEKPDGLRATQTRVGKIEQDPQDVPQALTSLTRELLDQQQAASFKEALRNVSGLTFNAAEGGRSGDNAMLRSFYTFGDTYLDGIRDTAQYNRETFDLEQIDVLRGAGAMLFGRGQAGGVINQVSKTAQLKDENKVNFSLGSNGYRESTGDFNKKFNESTAIRVNVMQRDEGSWRSNPVTSTEPDIHRNGLAVNLATGLRTADEVTFNYLKTQTNDNPDYGVPFNNGTSGADLTRRPTTNFPDAYFWGVDANFDRGNTEISTLTHTHHFADSDLRTQIRNANYERVYWASAPSNTTAPDFDGNSAKTRKTDNDDIVLQSDYSTSFEAFDKIHEFLAGVEYLQEEAARWSLLDIDPSANVFYTENSVTSPAHYQGKTYSAYAQDTVEIIPDWKFLLGARKDQLNAEYSSLTSPQLNFGEWSYRSGLSWQPAKNAHYYLTWSDSFSPTADLYQLSGSAYPAERSQVTELGAKWLFLNDQLAFRTALYSATKNWERNTDLESTASILTKKRRTNGLEFELTGNITPQWEIFSGVAFMNAKILEVAENRNTNTGALTPADPRFTGQRPANTPEYTLNIWTTYKLTPQWQVGGGVESKGNRYGYNPSSAQSANTDALFNSDGEFTPNTAPAYQRWDAMIAYQQTHWLMRLTLRNVFDKVYYDSVYVNGGFTVPGTRRAAILTSEFKF